MAEPTLKEHLRAMLDVSPCMLLTLSLSSVIAIVRLFVVMGDGGNYVEALGLFTPWFIPWFLVLLSTTVISFRSDEIDSRANKLAANRLREQFSKLY